MEGKGKAASPSTPQRPITEDDLCYCMKLAVEKVCLYDEANCGRKMLQYPDRMGKGYHFSRWIESPLEPRAIVVIQDVLK